MNRSFFPQLVDAAYLFKIVDSRRLSANERLNPQTKAKYGQFMTPSRVAQFMASFFQEFDGEEVRLLDAGAGVGSLTAAAVGEFCSRIKQVPRITATAYETDMILAEYLEATLGDCAQLCRQAEVAFTPQLVAQDFIETYTAPLLTNNLFQPRFTHAILNPPYKKIHSASDHRRQLRAIGVETSNLYTGFLALTIKLLEPNGELVAITPRSFCNGPYFKPFRQLLLKEMSIRRIHIFESRTHAFKDDDVLQENIILYAVKQQLQEKVTISVSSNTDFDHTRSHQVSFSRIVNPHDSDQFIHIATNNDDHRFTERMKALPCTLKDLGIDVSTGPVVDFRLKEYLRRDLEVGAVPLIYPLHCRNYVVTWPIPGSKKPNAIMAAEPVQRWLYPNGYYVVVRRLSAKEERRRVVAVTHDPNNVPGETIGFENHVNVFHHNRHGLSPDVARGLTIYLNSTLYDVCFRQFNGHTQVNVRDLYNLRYPDLTTLAALGKTYRTSTAFNQDDIDTWIEKELF